jgi:hypothetical protein
MSGSNKGKWITLVTCLVIHSLSAFCLKLKPLLASVNFNLIHDKRQKRMIDFGRLFEKHQELSDVNLNQKITSDFVYLIQEDFSFSVYECVIKKRKSTVSNVFSVELWFSVACITIEIAG